MDTLGVALVLVGLLLLLLTSTTSHHRDRRAWTAAKRERVAGPVESAKEQGRPPAAVGDPAARQRAVATAWASVIAVLGSSAVLFYWPDDPARRPVAFLVVVAVGALSSASFIRLAIRLAPGLNLLDVPSGKVQQIHDRPVPRVGGWGVVLGSFVPILLVLPSAPWLEAYVVGGTILFLVGVCDDAWSISHYRKFLFQALAVGTVVWHGDLWIARMPYFGEVPAVFGKPFTVFAIVGAINAINHSDGLDGLAGGEVLLSLVVIAVLTGLAAPASPAMLVACAALGGVLGFLPWNTHPARIFLGDSGSQFLGFTLGVLVVYLTQLADTSLSPAVAILLLGFPVVDILVVLGLRIRGGMHWFRATRNHVHHRLLSLGLGQPQAVRVIWLVHGVLALSALMLRYENDWWIAGWYVVVCLVCYACLGAVERRRSPLARDGARDGG